MMGSSCVNTAFEKIHLEFLVCSIVKQVTYIKIREQRVNDSIHNGLIS